MCMHSKYARLIIHRSPNTRERLIIVNHVRRGCLYVNQNEMRVFCSTRLQTLALQWSQKECKNIHVLIFISTFAWLLFFLFKVGRQQKYFQSPRHLFRSTSLWFMFCKPSLYLIYAGAFCKIVLAWKNLTKKPSDMGACSHWKGRGGRGIA